MDYEELTSAGIDMKSLLDRLMGNASLVRMFIGKFLEDQNMEKLTAAFAQKDMAAAEMASHTLKGMCGNLSLTELYALFTEQTNRIRSGDYGTAEAMMEQITARYQRTVAGMQAFLSK